MKMKLTVMTSEKSGLPYTWVPAELFWDFVEYLTAPQNNVMYGYRYSADGFIINFHRMNSHAVEKLLNDWSVGVSESPPFGSVDASACDLWEVTEGWYS